MANQRDKDKKKNQGKQKPATPAPNREQKASVSIFYDTVRKNAQAAAQRSTGPAAKGKDAGEKPSDTGGKVAGAKPAAQGTPKAASGAAQSAKQGRAPFRQEEKKQEQPKQQAAPAPMGPKQMPVNNDPNVKFAQKQFRADKQTDYKVKKVDLQRPSETMPPEEKRARAELETAGREGRAPGMTYKYDTGSRDIAVDVASLKTDEQAYLFAGTMDTDKEKERLLALYADENGLDKWDVVAAAERYYEDYGKRLFAQPRTYDAQARAAYRQLGEIGLMDITGEPLDVSRAGYEGIRRAILTEPDEDVQKAGIALLKTLTKIPENDLYGMDVSALENAAPAMDGGFGEMYSRFKSETADKFNPNLSDEERLDAYREQREAIEGGKYTPYQRAALERLLDAQYGRRTGRDVRDVQRELESATEGEAQAGAEPEGAGGGEAAGPAEQDARYGPYMDANRAAGEAGEFPPAPAGDGEPAAGQALTAAQALAAYRRGETLGEDAYRQIAWFVEDEAISEKLLYPMAADPENMYMQDIWGGMSDMEAMDRYMTLSDAIDTADVYYRLGKTMGGAAQGLMSGALPGEVVNGGLLVLGDVMRTIDARVESGELAVSEGVNPYEAGLAADPALLEKVTQVKDLQKAIDEIDAYQEEQERAAIQAQYEAAQERFRAGKATQEDMALMMSRADPDVDLNRDERRKQYRAELDIMKGSYYAYDGEFWKGGSAAAQEGLRRRGQESAYWAFSHSLHSAALDVIDDYTVAAAAYGMTLGEYMDGAGLGLPDIMDAAYTRMQRDGHQALADPELQAAMDEAQGVTTTVGGVINAAASGAAHGVVDFAEDAASLPANAYEFIRGEEALQRERREELAATYTERYGPRLASQMYRADLELYLQSGALSEESARQLRERMDSVSDIFDVAYVIEAGFVEKTYRSTLEGLNKCLDSLEANTQYMSQAEQVVFYGASGLTYNLAGMSVAAVTGNASLMLGGNVTLSKVVGTAVGFGINEWSNAYEAYRRMGMSSKMAGYRAFGDVGITMIANIGGTGSSIDMIAGRPLMQEGLEILLRRGPKAAAPLIKGMARQIGQKALEEGGEEMGEGVMKWLYALSDDAALAIDRGEEMPPSALLGSVWQNLTDTDPAQLMRQLTQAGLGGMVYGALFAMVGVGRAGYKANRVVKSERRYKSLGMAGQIARGELEATDATLGEFVLAFDEDSRDARFRRYVSDANRKARTNENTLVAAMMGVKGETRDAAVEMSRQAGAQEAKARADEQAAGEAGRAYMEKRTAALAGDLQAAQSLEGHRTAWATAQASYRESAAAAQRSRQRAAALTGEWLSACESYAVNTLNARESARAAAGLSAMREKLGAAMGKPQSAQEADSRAAELDRQIEAMMGSLESAEGSNLDIDALDALSNRYGEWVAQRERLSAAEGRQGTRDGAGQAVQTGAEQAMQADAPAQWPAAIGQTEQADAAPGSRPPIMRDAAFRRLSKDIKKQTGLDVVVASLPQNVRGYYDAENRRIVLSDKLNARDAARVTAFHELTHHIEGFSGYEAYRKAALDAIYGGDAAAIESALEDVRRRYGEQNITLTREGAMRELVAGATEKIIADADGRLTRQLLGQGKRGFLTRVYDALTRFIARKRAQRSGTLAQYDAIERARLRLREALAGGQADKVSNRKQYAIVQDEEGRPMVRADRKVVLSSDPKQWNDEIQGYIQQTIRKNGDVNIQNVEGGTLRITEKSQWHAGSRNHGDDDMQYRTKLNASAHLDELAQISKEKHPGRKNIEDTGNRHKGLASAGWRYRTAVFEDYDQKRYLLTMSVAHGKQGKAVYNVGSVKRIK